MSSAEGMTILLLQAAIPQLTLFTHVKARVIPLTRMVRHDLCCLSHLLSEPVPSCLLGYNQLPLSLIKCNPHSYSLCLKPLSSFDHVTKSLLTSFLSESNNVDKAYLDSPIKNPNPNQQHSINSLCFHRISTFNIMKFTYLLSLLSVCLSLLDRM